KPALQDPPAHEDTTLLRASRSMPQAATAAAKPDPAPTAPVAAKADQAPATVPAPELREARTAPATIPPPARDAIATDAARPAAAEAAVAGSAATMPALARPSRADATRALSARAATAAAAQFAHASRAAAAGARGSKAAADAVTAAIAATDAQSAAERLAPPVTTNSTGPLPTPLAGLQDAPAAERGSQSPAAASYPLPTPLRDPGFAAALADRVRMIVNAKLQSAELVLNPAELGPVRIEVSMQADAATVSFTASHPETRSILEQSLPRLREMLGNEGLQLGGASVDSGGARRESAGAAPASRRNGSGTDADRSVAAATPDGAQVAGAPRHGGRVSLFA
ncbi:MAG TPA: flagellar hook-length control protein FliK, partial [Burkholderiaceae bacterium]|nr:flagellar hook-length control protein FliK [Burkholderiaceae bacterium]